MIALIFKALIAAIMVVVSIPAGYVALGLLIALRNWMAV